MLERFQFKVWPRGDCWEFRSGRSTNDYRVFTYATGEAIQAHRYAHLISKGDIAVGMQVDHRCGHRWCVRPSHLEVVTAKENSRRAKYIPPEARPAACGKGHPFTPENTRMVQGHRQCKTCQRQWVRRKNGNKARVFP